MECAPQQGDALADAQQAEMLAVGKVCQIGRRGQAAPIVGQPDEQAGLTQFKARDLVMSLGRLSRDLLTIGDRLALKFGPLGWAVEQQKP